MTLAKLYERANALVYRGHMRDMLDGIEDTFAISVDDQPPFSLFLDVLYFYQSYRRLELVLSRAYPIPTDHTQFFSAELDVRRKSILG